LPEGHAEWNGKMTAGSTLQMGEAIGTIS
jgi:hypothetical protein